jgi:hypothetical protein
MAQIRQCCASSRAIEVEHEALAPRPNPSVQNQDSDVLIASAADKVVSIAAITTGASRSGEPAPFWRCRRAFIDRVPYFEVFAATAEAKLPASLPRELHVTVAAPPRPRPLIAPEQAWHASTVQPATDWRVVNRLAA